MKGNFIIVILLIMLCDACQQDPENEGNYYNDKKDYSAISDFYISTDILSKPDTANTVLNIPNKKISKPQALLDVPAQTSDQPTNINPTTSDTDVIGLHDKQTTDFQKEKRPNIVIILADDLDDIFTPPYFSEVLPIVDSLKKTGIDFTNSFTPMSICCPSRAASLSGKYAHNNGVYRNVSTNGGWEYFRKNEPYTLAAYLSRSGYRTTMLGKYLNGYSVGEAKEELLPPYGWTDGAVFVNFFFYSGYDYDLMSWDNGASVNDTAWKADNREIKHFEDRPEDYSTDMLTRETISFIDKTEQNDDQPFFIFLCPTVPHWPLQPPPRHLDKTNEKWLNSSVPKRLNFNNDYGKLATAAEKEIPLDKSSWLRDTWKKRVRQMDKGAWYYNRTFPGSVPKPIKSFIQAEWYSRMGSLYALNDMLREVIGTLKEKNEWDNTLLIFTSDNGYTMGAHALIHKGNPYEESIRVPLVITGGDSLNLKTPGKVQEWVTNLDLMPTILNLAGMQIPDDLDGISLVPLLTGDTTTVDRDRFVLEYIGPGMAVRQFAYHPKLIMKRVPLYILDHPTFNAIRMKVEIEEQGALKEKTYKYIEWQRHTERKVLKFSDKFRIQDPELMAKLKAGNKKALRLKAKAEEVETELYDLNTDPYEMDNLLYYQPAQYRELAMKLKLSMREIILKR